MLKKITFIGCAVMFSLSMSIAQVFAVDEKALENQANMVAKLLISCRAIIAQNQGLFNNPEIGDKGFTGDVFISKVIEHFKGVTGVNVSLDDASSSDTTKRTLGSLLVSAKSVIDQSQSVLNIKDMGFKNIIPAIVGRRTGYKYNKKMGVGHYLKQTSLKYRNPANHPDAFETKILKGFEINDPKGRGHGEVITNTDGSKIYRYMLPVYIKEACLKCHGDPKGEKDIAGRIKEGYKVGEIRGAISVMLPYE